MSDTVAFHTYDEALDAGYLPDEITRVGVAFVAQRLDIIDNFGTNSGDIFPDREIFFPDRDIYHRYTTYAGAIGAGHAPHQIISGWLVRDRVFTDYNVALAYGDGSAIPTPVFVVDPYATDTPHTTAIENVPNPDGSVNSFTHEVLT